ncbi:hypothetical protein TNCV_1389021 [Trichonephila clavipes]|nr:hypothetical protein TNCV_1389021 [Trichonephila clavipes]
MDVCKCIVPLRQGGTLNSRRAVSPLVRLVEGEERWDATDHPQGFSIEIGVNQAKSSLGVELTIPFVTNRDPQDSPQQPQFSEAVHYHPSE